MTFSLKYPHPLIYLDTETTGLDTDAAIIQLAAMIEIDGEIVDAFDAKIRPFPEDKISDEALAINRRTREEIATYKSASEVHKWVTARLGRWVNKYDKNNKFQIVAYNAQFDTRMLEAWFRKNGDVYYGSWFHRPGICLYSMAGLMKYLGYLPTPNLKQETVAKHFGITFDAHDAREDVQVSRKLLHKFLEILGSPEKLSEKAVSLAP